MLTVSKLKCLILFRGLRTKTIDRSNRHGRLLGRLENLGLKLKREATLRTLTRCKCSTDTALRDIQELKGRGILIQNPGSGRSTSYRLPDEVEMTSIQLFEYDD